MIDHGPAYLLQPDSILPMQYHARYRHRALAEQNLAFAVLQDAINCYQKHAFAVDRRGRRLFHETEGWVMNDEVTPFSFMHLCEVLAFNPAYLRKGLERWRELEMVRRLGAVEKLNGTHN